jgi:hypothetical protein
MIFGVSFSISIDEENIKWTKTPIYKTVPRVFFGLSLAALIDYSFYYFSQDLINHTSIYFWRYLLPYMTTTFFIYGVMPGISEGIGLSRLSLLRDQYNLSTSPLTSKNASMTFPFQIEEEQESNNKGKAFVG